MLARSMSRCRFWRRVSALAALVLCGPVAAHAGAPPQAAVRAEERLILAATVNGAAQPEPVIVRRVDGALWMQADDLRSIGVATSATGDVALASIPGLTTAVDMAAQTITLTTAGARQRIRVAQTGGQGTVPLAHNGWGAIVNYDASATRIRGDSAIAGTLDAVVFTPHGHAYAGAIGAAGARGGQRGVIRLDTGYTFTDPSSARRVTVGDFINAAASFSRPVRMAGVRVGTDFSLRPDLVTFPLPVLNGSAAVPSAVDLVVNGNRRALGDVRAGQFAISDVPVQTGINTITVAVRDALGRQTTQTVTTYASRALLRGGLSDYSLEAGAVRTGYGTGHDRYRSLLASGSVRYGLDDRTTIEGHFEATRSVAAIGAGASRSLGGLGLVDVSAAASRSAGQGGGAQLAAGFERVGRPVTLSARYTWTGRGWRDVAARYGSVTRANSIVANIGFDLGRLGTVGASVIDLGTGRRDIGQSAARTVRGATLVNASYSARIARRLTVVGNLGTDLRQRGSTFASVGALLVFGSRTSGYAGATLRNGLVGGNAEYIHTAVGAGQWGYRAAAATGAFDRVAASLEYLGQRGHAEAQLENIDGEFAARVSARGAVVLAEGRLVATDTMGGSFALVDTTGQAGVPIYRDNRRIGVSNRRGRLIVPNLAPYQTTKFSIDPTDLDPEMTIATADAEIRPRERVGVPVRFDLAVNRTARVRLVDAGGVPIAAGARASVGTLDLPVGMDGELYLPRVAATNRLTVRLAGGRHCTASFAPPATLTLATVIGPVVCRTSEIATLP